MTEQKTRSRKLPKQPQKEQPLQTYVHRTIISQNDRAFKSDIPEVDDQNIAIRCFVTEPAEVTLEQGLTMNLGNFETAKITVGIRVPCYVEEVNDIYTLAQQWVSDRIQAERKAVLELMRERAGELFE